MDEMRIYAAPPRSYGAACVMRLGLALWRLGMIVTALIAVFGLALALFAVKGDWVLCLPVWVIAVGVGAVSWLVRKVLVG